MKTYKINITITHSETESTKWLLDAFHDCIGEQLEEEQLGELLDIKIQEIE